MIDNGIVCLFPAYLVWFEKVTKKERRKNTGTGRDISKTKKHLVPSLCSLSSTAVAVVVVVLLIRLGTKHYC